MLKIIPFREEHLEEAARLVSDRRCIEDEVLVVKFQPRDLEF